MYCRSGRVFLDVCSLLFSELYICVFMPRVLAYVDTSYHTHAICISMIL